MTKNIIIITGKKIRGGFYMFTVEEKEKMGKYLREKIGEKYTSQKAFATAYIMEAGQDLDDRLIPEAQRVSGILNGTKEIQTYDLPIYSKLLGISCEEILSAGEYKMPTENHMTNYKLGYMRDESQWDRYLNGEDKTFFRFDEYGKNVIDYALEAKNIKLIKYMIDKEYIIFSEVSPSGYAKYLEIPFVYYPENGKWKEYYSTLEKEFTKNLKGKIISLAIEKEDVELLEKCRAREYPGISYWGTSVCYYENKYDKKFVDQIVNASEKVIDYFTDEFEMNENLYMFRHISDIIKLMIENNHACLGKVLNKVLRHNKEKYLEIKAIAENTFSELLKEYESIYVDKEECRRLAFNRSFLCYSFNQRKEDGLVNYIVLGMQKEITTNFVNVDAVPAEKKYSKIIDEINGYYDKVFSLGDNCSI